jgi:hypothetical protein
VVCEQHRGPSSKGECILSPSPQCACASRHIMFLLSFVVGEGRTALPLCHPDTACSPVFRQMVLTATTHTSCSGPPLPSPHPPPNPRSFTARILRFSTGVSSPSNLGQPPHSVRMPSFEWVLFSSVNIAHAKLKERSRAAGPAGQADYGSRGRITST